MHSRPACENPVKLLIYLVYCTLKYKKTIAKLGFSLLGTLSIVALHTGGCPHLPPATLIAIRVAQINKGRTLN